MEEEEGESIIPRRDLSFFLNVHPTMLLNPMSTKSLTLTSTGKAQERQRRT